MTNKQQAAIIGGGVIGGGWAARFLLSGWDVTIFDPAPDAKRKVDEVLANARRSLPALYERLLPQEGHLTFVETIHEAVQNADWVQESVPERLDIKHKVLAEIEASASEATLIGSSTSGFKPSELQQGAKHPSRIFVAHPFNPVYLLPLVELVGDSETTKRASHILDALNMKPLIVRKEIDAHIADRLLEAVWREGLWLIKDDIATTEEIDDAIRFGFGLRWAQMGLFETYRIAGGEAGMAHFIAQFGPCLKWPWTKLMDVPELTPELIEKIASQSDAQSGALLIRDLERTRDDNLVAMMRALKGRNWGAGALLNKRDKQLKAEHKTHDHAIERIIPIDWTDYNFHMNESRYCQIWSDAADVFLQKIGAGQDYVDQGHSFFSVETNTKFLIECHAGDKVHVETDILLAEGKKLQLAHRLINAKGDIAASATQMMIHVSLTTRRACEPVSPVKENIAALEI